MIMAICAFLMLYSLVSNWRQNKEYKKKEQKCLTNDATEYALLKEKIVNLDNEVKSVKADYIELSHKMVSTELLHRIYDNLKTVSSLQIEVEKLKMIVTLNRKYENDINK